MENIWQLKPLYSDNKTIELATQLNFPIKFTQLLLQRHINTFEKARLFFKPTLNELYDPFLMRDMDKAAERILKAIQSDEKILVYGDYDVDGTTAVAMMYLFLSEFSQHIDYYVPDRYNEGYGVSKEGIDYAIENDISLIISLDCGIKANDNIAYAKANNIDFIVCDHHLPGDILPDAFAVLDPQRSDCSYPFKYLSGCGVGFKLIQALVKLLPVNEEKAYEYLDLVAVSIAADIVPLVDENRILAKYGLEKLEKNPRMGLKTLLPDEIKQPLTISNIVFGVAPKINAAGRIEHASEAVELLISDNKMNALGIVSGINQLNSTRKELDASITEEALNQVVKTKQEENYTTIVYHESWHKGVLGIVASRLIGTYYKPTLVFTRGMDNQLVASARSVREFDIHAVLEQCSHLLTKYGGHMYAAGLSLDEDKFEEFCHFFEKTVSNSISEMQRIPVIEIDMEINFEELTDKFFRLVGKMEPFGPENMHPLFLTKNVRYGGVNKIMGKNGEHLKFNVFEETGRKVFDVTAFSSAHLIKKIKKYPFDMVYALEENHWEGKVYNRLLLKDIKFHDS